MRMVSFDVGRIVSTVATQMRGIFSAHETATAYIAMCLVISRQFRKDLAPAMFRLQKGLDHRSDTGELVLSLIGFACDGETSPHPKDIQTLYIRVVRATAMLPDAERRRIRARIATAIRNELREQHVKLAEWEAIVC
jgi:hypothetical protein